MDYRNTRNRKGQTGLAYTTLHASTHRTKHDATPDSNEKQNRFTRFLLFQIIAAATILSVFTGIRLIDGVFFGDMQAGMMGNTFAGKHVTQATQEIVKYMQDSETFSQLFPSDELSQQGNSARWTSVFLGESSCDTSIDESYIYPISYSEITSYFGQRNDPFSQSISIHNGWDMAAAEGTNVLAVRSGTVRECSYDEIGGYFIVIEHAEQISTYYGHLSDILVEVGQEITGGECIGLSGNTGKTTGPHLHFEIAQNGTPVDPARFLHA